CEVTVKEPKINKKAMTLKTGKTGTVKLTNTKFKASEIEWESSDEDVVEILENGKIKAVSPGEATVSTSRGEYVYECEVTVK
ncbi:MAG: Ig-like domain-containing protein, partial [Lachnospiraceae bacterium]|nr:Ig-like domain-containing protein [Lachnospiraceae bacterium]